MSDSRILQTSPPRTATVAPSSSSSSAVLAEGGTPTEPAPVIHSFSRPSICVAHPDLRTKLSDIARVPNNRQFINTAPVLLLEPIFWHGQQLHPEDPRVEWWITNPDIYPARAYLRVEATGVPDFLERARPGMIIRLVGVGCVANRKEVMGGCGPLTESRERSDEPAVPSLTVLPPGKNWMYECSAYDSGDDGRFVEVCRGLWKQYQKEEPERIARQARELYDTHLKGIGSFKIAGRVRRLEKFEEQGGPKLARAIMRLAKEDGIVVPERTTLTKADLMPMSVEEITSLKPRPEGWPERLGLSLMGMDLDEWIVTKKLGMGQDFRGGRRLGCGGDPAKLRSKKLYGYGGKDNDAEI